MPNATVETGTPAAFAAAGAARRRTLLRRFGVAAVFSDEPIRAPQDCAPQARLAVRDHVRGDVPQSGALRPDVPPRRALARGLAGAAARSLQAAGANVTLIDLADFPMPIYNADLEARGHEAVDDRSPISPHEGLAAGEPDRRLQV